MDEYQKKLDQLFGEVVNSGASDLHISVGRPPTLRIDGSLAPLAEYGPLSSSDAEGLALALFNEEQREAFSEEKEIDLSYSFRDEVRFRVNVYMQGGGVAVALRLIPAKIKTIEELEMPPVVHRFSAPMQGFFLAVGPAGHGKSTTLAALIDEINHTRSEHIITIEDPIEYIFTQDKCIIDQRELGRDTKSFARALRSAFRQDPDIIMVGEMRDLETIATAITAAETGHLVFGTLHTNNAAQTIDRIIDTFPPEQQHQVRSQLAMTLIGVVSKRLIPKIDGGVVPACEVMFANSAVRNLIREGKTHEIDLVIETSAEQGMISLNRSLAELVKRGKISLEAAESYSMSSDEVRALVGR